MDTNIQINKVLSDVLEFEETLKTAYYDATAESFIKDRNKIIDKIKLMKKELSDGLTQLDILDRQLSNAVSSYEEAMYEKNAQYARDEEIMNKWKEGNGSWVDEFLLR